MTVRSRVAMLVAEFLGTGILATAVINVARSQIGIGYFVAFSMAIAFAVMVMVFGKLSGGHFNPAVTIGMWTLRKINTLQAVSYLAVQMLGAFAAWRLAEYFIGTKLVNLAGSSFEWKVLVAELVGTAVFAVGYAAAVDRKEDTGRMATTVGLSLFVGVIVASLASNAQLNPAVALANQSWDRAYIFGPIIGAVLGMNLYAYLFAPDAKSAGAMLVSSVRSSSRGSASRSAGRKPASRAKASAKKRPAARRRR